MTLTHELRAAHANEMRLHRLVLAREAHDEPTQQAEPGEGDMPDAPLIPDCAECGNPGYLCVCDWLNGLEFAA